MGLITNMNLCPLACGASGDAGGPTVRRGECGRSRGVVCAPTWIGLFVAMETCVVLGAGGGIGNAVCGSSPDGAYAFGR